MPENTVETPRSSLEQHKQGFGEHTPSKFERFTLIRAQSLKSHKRDQLSDSSVSQTTDPLVEDLRDDADVMPL